MTNRGRALHRWLPRTRPDLARVVLLAALYVALGEWAFQFSVEANIVTNVLFLSEGLALGFTIRWGPQMWPGVFLGQLVLAVLNGLPVPVAALVAAVNSAEAVLGWWLFRRLRLRADLARPQDAFGLLGLIALLLQPFSATLGTGVLLASGRLAASDWLLAWLAWWLGNTIGQALMTPAILTWTTPISRPPASRREGWLWSILFVLAMIAVFLSPVVKVEWPLLIFAFTYPLLAAITVRTGPRGAAAALVLLGLVSIQATATGRGPFAIVDDASAVVDSTALQIVYLDLFLAGAVALCLPLAASVTAKQRVERELAAANGILARLSTTDWLTGLGNRRHFEQTLAADFAEAVRAGHDLGLIMIDVDEFKAYNDLYGHQAGDECLRQISALIAVGAEGAGGRAARFGGEEFALIVPGADQTHLVGVAERIKADLTALAIEHVGSTTGQVTVCFGVARRSDGINSADDLVGRADAALYRAKRLGRDRIEADWTYAADVATSSLPNRQGEGAGTAV